MENLKRSKTSICPCCSFQKIKMDPWSLWKDSGCSVHHESMVPLSLRASLPSVPGTWFWIGFLRLSNAEIQVQKEANEVSFSGWLHSPIGSGPPSSPKQVMHWSDDPTLNHWKLLCECMKYHWALSSNLYPSPEDLHFVEETNNKIKIPSKPS
jgi:hypothetical protein